MRLILTNIVKGQTWPPLGETGRTETKEEKTNLNGLINSSIICHFFVNVQLKFTNLCKFDFHFFMNWQFRKWKMPILIIGMFKGIDLLYIGTIVELKRYFTLTSPFRVLNLHLNKESKRLIFKQFSWKLLIYSLFSNQIKEWIWWIIYENEKRI